MGIKIQGNIPTKEEDDQMMNLLAIHVVTPLVKETLSYQPAPIQAPITKSSTSKVLLHPNMKELAM